ncbi:MAG: hypothetical protein V2I43_28720, partial [Parvularcula sp.]|nr:hypothetical protein [Parvularcula sp.]
MIFSVAFDIRKHAFLLGQCEGLFALLVMREAIRIDRHDHGLDRAFLFIFEVFAVLVWPGPSTTFCRETELNVVLGDNL